jgi:UDP-N-acetyl-D-galactosamine dehydrogenase
VAEATKIIENTQRDLNISFMNEITLILYSLDIPVKEVLSAASTKWNFIPYTSGIVGGHCIGVNSYYLAYKSEEANYYPNFILSGRRVNELLPKFLARETIKKLIRKNINIKKARVAVLGITYKENCNDFRDTGVTSLIGELESFDVEVLVHDPLADPVAVKHALGINLVSWDELHSLEAIIIAVGHKQYIDHDVNDFKQRMGAGKLMVDVKAILDPKKIAEADLTLWQL